MGKQLGSAPGSAPVGVNGSVPRGHENGIGSLILSVPQLYSSAIRFGLKGDEARSSCLCSRLISRRDRNMTQI
jgi:hypothetical protein